MPNASEFGKNRTSGFAEAGRNRIFDMARPSLSPQMTSRIIDYIRQNDLAIGQHLPSQSLADAFKVSRAPIAAALRHLEQMHIVRSEANRGYFLVKGAKDLNSRLL